MASRIIFRLFFSMPGWPGAPHPCCSPPQAAEPHPCCCPHQTVVAPQPGYDAAEAEQGGDGGSPLPLQQCLPLVGRSWLDRSALVRVSLPVLVHKGVVCTGSLAWALVPLPLRRLE
jgi:hypothetical protein